MAEPFDAKLVMDCIETTIRARTDISGKRYFGGAAARIAAQVAKNITDKDTLIDELEKAFEREENLYF